MQPLFCYYVRFNERSPTASLRGRDGLFEIWTLAREQSIRACSARTSPTCSDMTVMNNDGGGGGGSSRGGGGADAIRRGRSPFAPKNGYVIRWCNFRRTSYATLARNQLGCISKLKRNFLTRLFILKNNQCYFSTTCNNDKAYNKWNASKCLSIQF